MNNEEIRQFEQLTGLRRLRTAFRRNLGKLSEQQQSRILFLIELANRELDLFFQAEAAKGNHKSKPKQSKMRTFHAARLDAEQRETKI